MEGDGEDLGEIRLIGHLDMVMDVEVSLESKPGDSPMLVTHDEHSKDADVGDINNLPKAWRM